MGAIECIGAVMAQSVRRLAYGLDDRDLISGRGKIFFSSP
jgi:hypothetical protein